MDKYEWSMVGFVWFLSLMGALLFGHEIGMVNGSLDERTANKQKLESCHRVLAGSIYEN